MQAGCKITLTPSRQQIHLRTEKSYAIILEYSQEHFQPKHGRKIKNIQLSLGEKNNVILLKVRVHLK